MALFPTNTFQSVHAKLNCTDCHDGIKEMVHPSDLPPAQCASCHEEEAKQYADSIHGMSKAMGASAAAPAPIATGRTKSCRSNTLTRRSSS